jgi:CheY-like chemotaxis protein
MPKIMVVDDLRDSADSLALLFDAMGHQTITSYDGQQAIDAAKAFGPDIVFLDINMPIVDGYGAARAIRTLNDSPPVLVALTAVSGPDAKRRADDAGFDFYVTKPADFNVLITIVDDLSRRLGDRPRQR